MPSLHIPEETYRRLAERAVAMNVSVEELVRPALDQLAQNGSTAQASSQPLTGEAWRREFDAWTREIESRTDRYPPGHVLDDSRESIYREREDGQLCPSSIPTSSPPGTP